MIAVSIKINRSSNVVWDYFTTIGNWSKWYGGGLKEVVPTWQQGAKLVWEIGGDSPIIKFIPGKEICLSGRWMDTTYKFLQEGNSVTIVEVIESDPKGGASFTDGGAAQKPRWEKALQKFKELVEEKSADSSESLESADSLILAIRNVPETNRGSREQEYLALLRLRRLHNELAKAKGEAKTQSRKWGKPALRGCLLGFVVIFIGMMCSILTPTNTPSSSIIHSINNIGMLLLIAGGFYLVFRLENRKMAILVSKADTALQDAVKEVGQQLPSVNEQLGGAAALLDQGRVEDAISMIEPQLNRGVAQMPVSQFTSKKENKIHQPSVIPQDTQQPNLATASVEIEPPKKETIKIGKNETPDNFDALVLQMVELVKEGNRWGKINGYPLFEKYPQYNEIQEIGKKFYEMGGRELMQKAYATVAANVSWSEMSEHWWNGIGGWHA